MNRSRGLGGEAGRKIRVDDHRDQLFTVHLQSPQLPVGRDDCPLHGTRLESIRKLDDVTREILSRSAADAARTEGGERVRHRSQDVPLEGVGKRGHDNGVEDDPLDGGGMS